MSQYMRATASIPSGRQGIREKVDASGLAIMSDSSTELKPVREAPSKPMPLSNALSSSVALIEKLLRCPSTSVNQSLMNLTSCCLTSS